jgi:Na+-transporting methylmalonyl-CoA/oxaloacetate decarboxylase gamma subunit
METPETGAYLMLGLGVTAVILFAFIGSLIARAMSTAQDRDMLERLEREDEESV